MRRIALSTGRATKVDNRDFAAVSRFSWYAARRGKNRRTFYAQRSFKQPDGSWKVVGLHKFLLPGQGDVDHRNGDGLDNRRRNLRRCSRAQNIQNSRRRCDNTSGYKGVSRNGAGWMANITAGGVRHYLGTRSTKRSAARLYDAAAHRYHKLFAAPNL